MNKQELQLKANEVRKGIVTAVHAAKAGHPGGSLSAADIFTYLYFEELNIDPKDPKKPDRDRFVLSKVYRTGTVFRTGTARLFPGRGFKDTASSRFVSAGTSGHEAHSGCGYVERFLRTGEFPQQSAWHCPPNFPGMITACIHYSEMERFRKDRYGKLPCLPDSANWITSL